MKNFDKKVNTKKLSAYSALAGAFILAGTAANAQIVYTDVDPDENIGIGDTYDMDMDNDGDVEFSIAAGSFTIPSFFSTTGTGGAIYNALINTFILYPTAGNAVSGSVYTASSGGVFNLPYALNNGANISAGGNFLSGSYMTMGLYLSVLDFPAPGSNYAFKQFGWINKNDKYLGLRFETDGNTYFGWARLSTENFEITLKDFAYESTPNTAISAGDFVSVKNVIPENMVKAYSYGNTVNVVVNNLNAKNAVIRITNTLGEIVYSNQLNQTGMQIKLDNAAEGIYVVNIVADGANYNKEVFINQ